MTVHKRQPHYTCELSDAEVVWMIHLEFSTPERFAEIHNVVLRERAIELILRKPMDFLEELVRMAKREREQARENLAQRPNLRLVR